MPDTGHAPHGGSNSVADLPRRTAHALFGLLNAERDLHMPPTAAEVCLYDPEALSVRATGAALAHGKRRGLCAVAPGGYWVAAHALHELYGALEDRVLPEQDNPESGRAPHGDRDAVVCPECGGTPGENGGCVYFDLTAERDRLREAARGVVIAYLAFHQPTMKAAIEKLVVALDA